MVVLGYDHLGRHGWLDRAARLLGSRADNLEALADISRLVRPYLAILAENEFHATIYYASLRLDRLGCSGPCLCLEREVGFENRDDLYKECEI